MPAPIDPTADFLAVYADEIVTVGVAVYDPVTDTQVAAVNVRGISTRGQVRATGIGSGEARVTKSQWWLLAADMTTRPTLQSLIVDTGKGETWAIDDVDPDPYGAVYRCGATLT